MEKVNVVTNVTKDYVVVKLDRVMLEEMFDDLFSGDFKIRNKKGFACDFSKTLTGHILGELETVMEIVADTDEKWIKYTDEDC